MAFNDINPQAPVHFLVIPKQKIAMLDDVKKDDTEVKTEYMYLFVLPIEWIISISVIGTPVAYSKVDREETASKWL